MRGFKPCSRSVFATSWGSISLCVLTNLKEKLAGWSCASHPSPARVKKIGPCHEAPSLPSPSKVATIKA